MTTTSKFVCPKCGTIRKSGKTSCCGRGGSWFKKCGSAGNTNFRHTWSKGVLACKTRAQLKVFRPRQRNGTQQLNSSYSIDIGSSQAVITPAETIVSNWISQGVLHASDVFIIIIMHIGCPYIYPVCTIVRRFSCGCDGNYFHARGSSGSNRFDNRILFHS